MDDEFDKIHIPHNSSNLNYISISGAPYILDNPPRGRGGGGEGGGEGEGRG